MAAYVAAKGSVFAAFTQALARELGKYGINVNAVTPRPHRNPTACQGKPHHNRAASGFVETLPRRSPASEEIKPEDIAAAVAFLASDDARCHRPDPERRRPAARCTLVVSGQGWNQNVHRQRL